MAIPKAMVEAAREAAEDGEDAAREPASHAAHVEGRHRDLPAEEAHALRRDLEASLELDVEEAALALEVRGVRLPPRPVLDAEKDLAGEERIVDRRDAVHTDRRAVAAGGEIPRAESEGGGGTGGAGGALGLALAAVPKH